MKVKWLGHASFLITAGDGTRIITDPYLPDARLKYAPINEAADIVTMSHDHNDHNNIASVKGNPKAVKGPGEYEVRGISFQGIDTFHDSVGGARAGKNTVFCFTVDGVRVCHLGDLGHMPSEAQLAEMGQVDVLLVPVGGNYTIDAATATELISKLKPKVAIPMHVRNPRCDFPVDTADIFISGKKNVKETGTSEVEFKKGKVPEGEIVVLKPAL